MKYQVSKLVEAKTEEEVRLGAFQWGRWITLGCHRSKAKAIAQAMACPFKCLVTPEYSAEVLFNNGCKPEINYSLAHDTGRPRMTRYIEPLD